MAFPRYTQLKMARAALGLDQRTVASAIGMSHRGFQALETEKSNPTLNTLDKLLRYYDEQGVEFGQNGWVRLRPSE